MRECPAAGNKMTYTIQRDIYQSADDLSLTLYPAISKASHTLPYSVQNNQCKAASMFDESGD